MLHTTPPWASLTRQSRGGNICLWEDFLLQCRSLLSHPGHPAWAQSIGWLAPASLSPGVNIARARDRHWDSESRYNDCPWSVSVSAPGIRYVTQSWHCHAVTRPVWCDVMSGGPRPASDVSQAPAPGLRPGHTPPEMSWASPQMRALMSDLWLPRDRRSSALSPTQPQSIQGISEIDWDLSKQRISILYHFFISNNPSPRIRTFKSQSNLTSDRWPGSISAFPIPSCPCLSLSLLMSSWPIRHPDTRQLSGLGVRMTLASIVTSPDPVIRVTGRDPDIRTH